MPTSLLSGATDITTEVAEALLGSGGPLEQLVVQSIAKKKKRDVSQASSEFRSFDISLQPPAQASAGGLSPDALARLILARENVDTFSLSRVCDDARIAAARNC